jgi:hypothetical protein
MIIADSFPVRDNIAFLKGSKFVVLGAGVHFAIYCGRESDGIP